jgi:nicotinate-nucleotide adenylyltransferase
MERLGVFGGTFDPVHVGHLVAAVNVRHALALDRVLFVVAHKPWQKGERVVAAAEDRAALVEAAVEGVEGLEVSRLELDRGGPSYSVDTLEQLAGQAELFLIVGADAAASIETWQRVDVVRELATLVVVTRAGWEVPDLAPGWRVEQVTIPRLEVSSTELRQRLADGRPVEFLIPPAAVRCLRERGLYPDPG